MREEIKRVRHVVRELCKVKNSVLLGGIGLSVLDAGRRGQHAVLSLLSC